MSYTFSIPPFVRFFQTLINISLYFLPGIRPFGWQTKAACPRRWQTTGPDCWPNRKSGRQRRRSIKTHSTWKCNAHIGTNISQCQFIAITCRIPNCITTTRFDASARKVFVHRFGGQRKRSRYIIGQSTDAYGGCRNQQIAARVEGMHQSVGKTECSLTVPSEQADAGIAGLVHRWEQQNMHDSHDIAVPEFMWAHFEHFAICKSGQRIGGARSGSPEWRCGGNGKRW